MSSNDKKQPVVAILGATGLVGTYLRELLEQRNFPLSRLKLLASERSTGSTLPFRGEELTVELACPEAFEGVDLVLASAGGSVSEQLVPEAVKRGAVVVDNTSHFRQQEGVPLVVAGVNNHALKEHNGIIANPNCSTAQLMPVLKALHQAAGLKRVIISTYQSVSGAGKEGLDELLEETGTDLQAGIIKANESDYRSQTGVSRTFPRAIAFNLIPKIDVFATEGEEAGYTKEELKLTWETRKILDLPELPIAATAVRVPVLVGHSEAVTVDLERPLSPAKAAAILAKTPDVVVGAEPEAYHTPRQTAGTDPVYVSRIRRDLSNPTHGLMLWVVADNLRIGAALNAVRIAEVLVAENLLKPAVQTV